MIDRDTIRAEIAALARRHYLSDPAFVHDNLDPDACACALARVRETIGLDGPTCLHCGGLTRRMGTCATCVNCGETTGCG